MDFSGRSFFCALVGVLGIIAVHWSLVGYGGSEISSKWPYVPFSPTLTLKTFFSDF